MNIERVRSILGVWAPMAIGVFIIVTSINFYFNANLTNGLFVGDLGSWRLVCLAGAFFVGGVFLLSTFGRFRKTKAGMIDKRTGPPKGRSTGRDIPSDDAPPRPSWALRT